MPEPCHRLVIPNQLSAIRQMSEWLDDTIRTMGISEEIIFKFDLCANEAVTNIISYAYQDEAERVIGLSLKLADGTLSLEIDDDGEPFNPLERAPHRQPVSLEDAEIGGLGIDLIRKFMDQCEYARQNGRNILKMMIRIAQ